MKKFRLSKYKTEHVILRDWLIEQRSNANITQRQLAEKLETVHSLVGKVEKGERRLDVIEFYTYCKALDADPIEFFEYLEKKANSEIMLK
jgi:transcriptional regulator with XRE-family HTH domain